MSQSCCLWCSCSSTSYPRVTRLAWSCGCVRGCFFPLVSCPQRVSDDCERVDSPSIQHNFRTSLLPCAPVSHTARLATRVKYRECPCHTLLPLCSRFPPPRPSCMLRHVLLLLLLGVVTSLSSLLPPSAMPLGPDAARDASRSLMIHSYSVSSNAHTQLYRRRSKDEHALLSQSSLEFTMFL